MGKMQLLSDSQNFLKTSSGIFKKILGTEKCHPRLENHKIFSPLGEGEIDKRKFEIAAVVNAK